MQSKEGGRLLERLSSEERKQYPMSSGLLDYFPDSLALISHISWLGNEKHNPGQPLHHARGKSTDHADCVIRHHSTRGQPENGVPLMHMAEEGWRVLAMLQEALEDYYNLDIAPGAQPPKAEGKAEEPKTASEAESDLSRHFDYPEGTEFAVQWTDISGSIARLTATDGPFPDYEAAADYIRDNPHERDGTGSICVFSRV